MKPNNYTTPNPIISKLLKLKFRINDTAKPEGGWSDDMSNDKRYVQSLILFHHIGGAVVAIRIPICNW